MWTDAQEVVMRLREFWGGVVAGMGTQKGGGVSSSSWFW